MSQYGAYGLAQHGRGYRSILHHYYRHTRDRAAPATNRSGCCSAGVGSVGFRKAQERRAASGFDRRHSYRFKRSGSGVTLRGARGRRLANCGRAGTARGGGTIRIGGKGVYRGKLRAKASGGGLLVINVVGLEGYTKGVVPNEMPSILAPGGAAGPGGGGALLRAGHRSGGRASTSTTTPAARSTAARARRPSAPTGPCRRTSEQGGALPQARSRRPTSSRPPAARPRASSTAFPAPSPFRYLKSVNDPYDGARPTTVEGALLAARDESRPRRPVLRPAAQDQGAEAGRLAADRQGAGGRLARQLEGHRARALRRSLGLRSTWARFRKR